MAAWLDNQAANIDLDQSFEKYREIDSMRGLPGHRLIMKFGQGPFSDQRLLIQGLAPFAQEPVILLAHERLGGQRNAS